MRPIWSVLFVLGCKGGEAPKPSEPPAKPAASVRAPDHDRPGLPAAPADHRAPVAIADAFAAEPIDAAWRGGTERDIRTRVPTAEAVECHRTLCRITIAGNEAEISAAIDRMENEQALRGIAASVLLTAPENRSDGKMAMQAYARFERSDAD